MLIGILAMTKDGLIGKDGGLPWHIPDDLRFFREMVKNKTMVMGKNTWKSMPIRPNQRAIVYTRDISLEQTEYFKTINTDEEIIELVFSDKNFYLIGGSFMFKTYGHLCDYFFITLIDEDGKYNFEGDSYFPLEILDKYTLISAKKHNDRLTGIGLCFKAYIKNDVMGAENKWI